MNGLDFSFHGETLTAFGTGALYWHSQSVLCVSDLHLGRTERIARTGGQIIPPYENTDTLNKLDTHITELNPRTVICLGDSFDDLAAVHALTDIENEWITRLQAGREWIWVEGNHDPAPIDLGGSHMAELKINTLTFRHISQQGAQGEVSGHYHPKINLSGKGRRLSRPAFVFDNLRMILPAFGTYTGGMPLSRPPLSTMFRTPSIILTGSRARKIQSHSATN